MPAKYLHHTFVKKLTMKKTKFETEITKTNTFTIIFDETIWNADKIAETAKQWDDKGIDLTLQSLAESIAYSLVKNGTHQPFHNGFGNIKMFKYGKRIKHKLGDWELKDYNYIPGIEVHIEGQEEYFYKTKEIQ